MQYLYETDSVRAAHVSKRSAARRLLDCRPQIATKETAYLRARLGKRRTFRAASLLERTHCDNYAREFGIVDICIP